MVNSTPSADYRKSKLDEIKKINDLNLEDSTKKSLVRKALKDALSDPKIQEAQDEKRTKKTEEIAMQKLIKEKEYNRLLWLSDTINESFDEFDNRTNKQISVLKKQEDKLTEKERQLCGEGFLPSDIYQAQQNWIKKIIFDKGNNIEAEKTNCIFDFEDPKQKYIIANVDGKQVAMCLPELSNHKDLLEKLKYLYPNQSIEVKWWWYIHIDPLKKEIYIFWSSKDFDYAEFDVVSYYVLEKQFPWYIIKDLGNTFNTSSDYDSEMYKNFKTFKSIINWEKVELNTKNVMIWLIDYRELMFDFFIENVGPINQSLLDNFTKQYNLDPLIIDSRHFNENGSIKPRRILSSGVRELFIWYLIQKVKENTWLNYFSLNIPLEKRKVITLKYYNPKNFEQYVPSDTVTQKDIKDIQNREGQRYFRIWHH